MSPSQSGTQAQVTFELQIAMYWRMLLCSELINEILENSQSPTVPYTEGFALGANGVKECCTDLVEVSSQLHFRVALMLGMLGWRSIARRIQNPGTANTQRKLTWGSLGETFPTCNSTSPLRMLNH